MNRRNFLKSSSALLALFSVSCMNSQKKSRPNILLFFADDQRASTIHALGNEHIHTPNLDKLVERGVSFTRAYMMGGMTGATCIPSRAMLHTGKHLFNLQNKGHEYGSHDVTIPEHLRANGYFTYFTGKRHSLTREKLKAGFEDGGVVMGFAGYYTDKRRMPIHDWEPECDYKWDTRYVVSGAPGNPKVAAPERNDKEAIAAIPPGPFSTQLYVNPAVEKIHNVDQSKPWFMYVSLSTPHDPHEAPEDIRAMYDPEKIPLPKNFLPEHPFDNGDMNVRDEKLASWPRDPQVIKQRTADYYAAVTLLDQQFGRLIYALEQTDQIDNTIIIYAGDSGLAIGQHGLMGKQNLYDDAGVHVPFIMAGPGIPQNEQRDALVTTCDIFPTLCDISQTTIPESVDGKSLSPIIKDSSQEIHNSIYLGYREFQRAVIEKQFKLIEYARASFNDKGETKTAGTRFTQLFDLKNDPWETTNLADQPEHVQTLNRLQEKLQQLRIDHNDGTEQGRVNHPEMHDQYMNFWDNY